MNRYATMLICAALVGVGSVASAERIKVPCAEWRAVTGQDLCDRIPFVNVERSQWEGMERAAARDRDRPKEDKFEFWQGESSEACVQKSIGGEAVELCTLDDGTTYTRPARNAILDSWQ